MNACNCYTCGNACVQYPDQTKRCYKTGGKIWFAKYWTQLFGCYNWKYIDPSLNALVIYEREQV